MRWRIQHLELLLCLCLSLAASPTLVAIYLTTSVPTIRVSSDRALKSNAHQDERNRGVPDQRRVISSSDSQPNKASLQCVDAEKGPCCAAWNVDTDDWWLHHPTWDVVDNTTHTCFHRIQDDARASFLEKVYDRQWVNTKECVQQTQISSGFAAAIMATTRSFYAAYKSGQTFQITKGHVNANWNFSPRNASHWAYCESEDMNCYFLPLSSCKAELGRNDAARGTKPSAGKAKEEFYWLRQYAFRRRHKLRQRLQQFMVSHKVPNSLSHSCVALHVRRGDIAFGRGRRYAAVREYLEAGKVQPGTTVVLLTDDTSTIDEVEQYYKSDYSWVVLDRPRFRGPEGGFEGFLPSGDPAQEVLSILTEIHLAGQCSRLIHGKSGFVTVITDAMRASGKPFETVYLQTQQNKKEQAKMDPKDRASLYLDTIQKKLANNTYSAY